MKHKTWIPTDLTNAKPICARASCIEFQDKTGEFHYFELLKTNEKIVFGGFCNVGFLESGYIVRENGETLDETLSELLSDLGTFYNDGANYTTRIVFNERM